MTQEFSTRPMPRSQSKKQDTPDGPTTHCWQSYQLLPKLYIQREKAKSVIQCWAAINLALLCILSGLATLFLTQGRKLQTQNSNVISLSAPVNQLKSEVSRMTHETKTGRQWIAAVESAKPDDSVLQTLLAIAEMSSPLQADITIETVEVKLPLEHLQNADQPAWAKAKLRIVASTPMPMNEQAIELWADQLQQSERIRTAELHDVDRASDTISLEIRGEPESTKVVP
ncbi:hypothetical protein [Planctomycetes bacterium K23_9]|uniref:Fimbrial assembly protein (PilN) n=1 Tax=Stieleria marina TaxID=1930275 RepID=A0A517NS96_9BACT|nr:hypothetical protein K239x_19600 [Planctomycetes bacterium K23_9]